MDERQELLKKFEASKKTAETLLKMERRIGELDGKIVTAKAVVMFAAIIGFLVSLIALAISNFAGFVCLVATFGLIIKNKSNIKSYNQEINELDRKMAEIWRRPEVDWFPPSYRSAFYYKKVEEYLLNYRASTLKECINLLETENHRRTVEQQNAEILRGVNDIYWDQRNR